MGYQIIDSMPVFHDLNGEQLDGGLIYIGEGGLNPETNPIVAYWDEQLTQPISQPISTVSGYPSKYGVPSKIYISDLNQPFSITVKTKNLQVVYSNLQENNNIPIISAYTIETVNDFANVPSIYKSAIVKDLNRGGTFIWSATGTANGGTVFAGATGYWNRQYSGAVNVKWFGAVGDGATDDRLAIQKTLYYFDMVFVPSGVYIVNGSIFIPSNKKLLGDGGISKKTILKRNDGGYTDVIVAGEWDEGITHDIAGYLIKDYNGYRYSALTKGNNISIEGIYIDVNGNNAGTPPVYIGLAENEVPYRGSGVFIQYVDGVEIKDTYSYNASNDGFYLAYNKNIKVLNSVASDNFLIGNKRESTRNGFTISGGFDDTDTTVDITVDNVKAINTEDIGVMFSTGGSTLLFGGTINISNVFTENNNTGGLWVEMPGGSVLGTQNVNISNILSVNDDNGTTSGCSMLVAGKSRNFNLSNINIVNSYNNGLILQVSNTNINISNLNIDKYGLNNAVNVGLTRRGLYVYATDGGLLNNININNMNIVSSSDSCDSYGVALNAINTAHISNFVIDGNKYVSNNATAGFYAGANYIKLVNGIVKNMATRGIQINSGRHNINSVEVYDINLSNISLPSFTITGQGTVSNCTAINTTGFSTIGFYYPSTNANKNIIYGCISSGHSSADLLNTGVSGMVCYANTFEYLSATVISPLQTSAIDVGAYDGRYSYVKLGGSYVWAFGGKLYIKTTFPTSDTDGIVVGTQV